MPAKKILIVEPNKNFSDAITDLVSALGVEVVAATPKKSEILNLAQELEPDLVIVDYDMAKGEGGERPGIEVIKEHLPDTKILVLGFYDAVEELLESLWQKGFDGFYNKFDSSDGLLKALKTLLV